MFLKNNIFLKQITYFVKRNIIFSKIEQKPVTKQPIINQANLPNKDIKSNQTDISISLTEKNDFKKLFQTKDFEAIFERLCRKQIVLKNEKSIFDSFFLELKYLINQKDFTLLSDFYLSIIQHDHFLYKNKDYIFLIFEKSLFIFNDKALLDQIDIESLLKILQFYIHQKAYINNLFYFKIINSLSIKLYSNKSIISIEIIVKIIECSKILRYLHFKLLDVSVDKLSFIITKKDSFIEPSDLLIIVEGLSFLGLKASLTRIVKLRQIDDMIRLMEDNLVKLQIIAYLALNKTLEAEKILKYLDNLEKLELTNIKEVSYMKFIILLLKLYDTKLNDFDHLVNLKFSHIKPFRIASHYDIENLDFFNFVKFYLKTHFLKENPTFKLEIDYSVNYIFFIPFKLSTIDKEYYI